MDLFETFLQEKKFLNGVTPKTISTYQCAYKAYQRVAGGLPTKQSLKQFVIQMQKNGMSVCGINSTLEVSIRFLLVSTKTVMLATLKYNWQHG